MIEKKSWYKVRYFMILIKNWELIHSHFIFLKNKFNLFYLLDLNRFKLKLEFIFEISFYDET
jgi:hypothetical protein